jgi:hypothetical protein
MPLAPVFDCWAKPNCAALNAPIVKAKLAAMAAFPMVVIGNLRAFVPIYFGIDAYGLSVRLCFDPSQASSGLSKIRCGRQL